jgi:outer membrane receptor protein involved in Fe transport
LTAIVAVLLFSSAAFGANVGKVSGRVVDRETGEGLPTVAVTLVGTSMGALTDSDGRYTILNVPVGSYDIKAELVGYQPVEKRGIFVSVDLTTYVDFELTSRAIEVGEVQVVQAERPLIIKDQTASLKLVSGDEVRNLPTRGYQNVVGLSNGVVSYQSNAAILTGTRGTNQVSNNPSLNIRGGRPNEVAYYIDGFETQDPLTGLSTTQVNNNAVEEVSITTGGFNAEYGWISSGAINVTTREGSKTYSGNIEGVTSRLTDNYDYDLLSVDLTGPIVPNSEKITLFASGERKVQKDRSPRAHNDNEPLTRNDLRGWTWQGKLRYDVTSAFIVRLGVLGSLDKWSRNLRTYYLNSPHMPYYEDKNNSFYAQITHNLSKNTFYTLKGNYFITQREAGDGIYFNDLWSYNRVTNPRFDPTALFWSGDNPETPEDEGHVWDDYLKRKSAYYGVNGDLTHQLGPFNEIKVGFEYQRHTLRYVDHLTPVQLYKGVEGGGLNNMDHYGYTIVYDYDANDSLIGAHVVDTDEGLDGAKHPYTFAGYVQDKFEWEGLVVNAGLRYDYLNVNTKRLLNEEFPLNPTGNQEGLEAQSLTEADLEDAKGEDRWSPRLGVGFPITDKTVFHLYYGKFFQRPELQNLYVSYTFLEYMVKTGPYYYPIGNPNLSPEETTAYEVGVTHQLGENSRLDITAYYKDVKNLTEVINQPSNPKSFATYRNQDYGTIKGLEFGWTLRRTKGISANLDYTFSYAAGTGSYATSQGNIAWTNTERPLRVAPLDFDQRHKLTAIFDVRAARGEGPKLGDIYPLENAGINLVFNVASGHPYTPMNIYDQATLASVTPTPIGPINSRYGPWTYRLDLKANKVFHVGQKFSIDAYVWILNVFNTDNPVAVYEGTGRADDTGWLATGPGQSFIETYSDPDYTGLDGEQKYIIKENDPNNYDIPRMIRLGMRVSF